MTTTEKNRLDELEAKFLAEGNLAHTEMKELCQLTIIKSRHEMRTNKEFRKMIQTENRLQNRYH